MSNNEHELLSEATCAVIDQKGIKGTAWLFSDSGYLLTAGHVISKTKIKKIQKVQFLSEDPHDTEVVKWVYRPEAYLDFAVLRLITPVRRRPVPISLAYSLKDRAQITSYGYGMTLQSLSPGIGKSVGTYTPTSNRDYRLFQIESGQLNDVGYSGAPLYVTEINAVVALQISGVDLNIGAQRDSIFGLPLYRIAQEFPDLFSYSPDGVVDDVASGDLDVKILLILYQEFKKRPANFKITIGNLKEQIGGKIDKLDLMTCLQDLKQKGWTLDNLIGETGFAWVTPAGIRIAREILAGKE